MLIIFLLLFLSQTCCGLNQNRPYNRNERKTHEGNTGEWWNSWWKNYIQEVTDPTVNPWICCKPQVSYPPPIRPPGEREFPQPPRVNHQGFPSSGFNQLHSSLSTPKQDIIIRNQFGNNNRVSGSVINGVNFREQNHFPQVRKITSKHPRSSISTQYFHLGTIQDDAIIPIDGEISQISDDKQNVQRINNGNRHDGRFQFKQQPPVRQQLSQNGRRGNFPQNGRENLSRNERKGHFRQNERGGNFHQNGRQVYFSQSRRGGNFPENGRVLQNSREGNFPKINGVHFTQTERGRNFLPNERTPFLEDGREKFIQNIRSTVIIQNGNRRKLSQNGDSLQNNRNKILPRNQIINNFQYNNRGRHIAQNGRNGNFPQERDREHFPQNGRNGNFLHERVRGHLPQNGRNGNFPPERGREHLSQNGRNGNFPQGRGRQHFRQNGRNENFPRERGREHFPQNGRNENFPRERGKEHLPQNGRNGKFPQGRGRGHFPQNPLNENIRQTGRNVSLLENKRETFSRENSQFSQNGRFSHQFSQERFETYRKPIGIEGHFNSNQQFQSHRSQINHSKKEHHRTIPPGISFNGNSGNTPRNFAVTSTQFRFSNHTRFQRQFELDGSQFSGGNNRVTFNRQNSVRKQSNFRNNFHSINNQQQQFFENHQSTPNRREFHSNRNQLSNNGKQTFSQHRTSFKFSQQISSEFPAERRQFSQFENVKIDNSIVTPLPEERNLQLGKDLNLNPQNIPNFRRFQENIRPLNFQEVNSRSNFQSGHQQFIPETKDIQTFIQTGRSQQFPPQQHRQQNINSQQIFPNFPQNKNSILHNPNFQNVRPHLRDPQFQQHERPAFHQSQQRPPFLHPQSSPPHLDQQQRPPPPHSQLRLPLIRQQEKLPFSHSQVIPPLPSPIENFQVSRPPRPDGPQVFHVTSRFKVQEDEKSQEFIIEKPYRENEPPFLPQKPHPIEYPQSKIYPPTKTSQYPDKSIKTTFPKQTETYPLITETHPPITPVVTYPPPIRPPTPSPKDEITIIEKPKTSVTPIEEECSTIGPPLILPRPDRPLPDGSIPPCAVGGKNFCLLTNDYPSDLVEEIVDKRKQTVKLMYEEVQTIGDPELFPDHLGNSSASRGDFLCSSEVEYARPGWIRDELSEEWMLVINTDLFPQKIRTESCRFPNGPCSYVAPFYQSTCQQRFSLHRLLSLDPHDPNRKPIVSLFKFPAGCSCRVDPVKRKEA